MTRDEFDKALGRDVSDNDIFIMKDEWVLQDYRDYVEASGYDVDPFDLYEFVQNFWK